MTKFFQQTSEAVSIGHPDKVADSTADSIVDFVHTIKPDAHTAVEVACGADKVFLFGEIDGSVDVSRETFKSSVEEIVKKRIQNIGYTSEEYSPDIIFDIVNQSQEINQAVINSIDTHETGAGDQGIMFGYAINETPEKHTLHFVLAHLIQKELEVSRETFSLPYLRPDSKSQVTVKYLYTEQGIDEPVAITDIVLSTQHTDVDFVSMQQELKVFVEKKINHYLTENNFKFSVDINTKIHINPAGPWHHGGPAFDSGLTGRKLVVDNYGGNAPIGGGAYSGKDLTKVDRSAAYYARYVAKSVVESGLAQKVQVALAYAIGESQPTMISIDTYGTGKYEDYRILSAIKKEFDFSVNAMISFTQKIKSFVKTSEHSHYLATKHFINNEQDIFPWEKAKRFDI